MHQKIFKSSFLRIIIRKTRLFFEDFCFRIRCSLLNTQFSNFAALRQRLLNSGWLPLTFEMTIFSFSANFCLIFTLNLCCYLMVVFCLISPYLATCSLKLHKPVASAVFTRLSTLASLALSTLAPMFFYSNKTNENDFIFFHVHEVILSFISLNLIFSVPIWSDSSYFFINNATGSRSIIIQYFGGGNFFQQVFSDKSFDFRIFLDGRLLIFESCFYSKLGNANSFALIVGLAFSWAACSDSYCQNYFSGQFSSKKWNIWIFSKQIRHLPLPTGFLNFHAQFLQTYVQDPFAFCVAALATL